MLAEFFDEPDAGTLAHVVHIFLVGQTEHENLRSLETLAAIVQGDHQAVDNVVGHTDVDLAGQFDEPRGHFVLASLPRQVERIDRDAVAAQAWARVERLEAERFGRRGVDDFPDVDVHLVEEHLQFVGQGDVHAAVNVFEDFARLGHFTRPHRHGALQHLAVEFGGNLGALAVDAPDDLGDVPRGEVRVARVFAFGAEGQEEVLAALEAALFEDRLEDIARRAGIGRRFENDDLPGLQPLGNLFARGGHEADVGLAHLVQRRRHADNNGVDFLEFIEIAGRPEPSGLDIVADNAGGDVLDVALAGIEFFDFSGVDVEAQHLEFAGTELAHQGQPDVAQPDNAYLCLTTLDFLNKIHVG